MKYSIIENSKGFKYIVYNGKKIVEKSGYYLTYFDAVYSAKMAIQKYMMQ